MTPASPLFDALAAHGGRTALAAPGFTLTYAQLLAGARQLAARLRGQQAVALRLHNCPAWIMADIACLMAGVVCVPLPPFFTPEQQQHVLRDAGVSLLLAGEAHGPAELLEVADTTLYATPLKHPGVTFPPGTAKVTYTSGTTGTPKGVCLSLAAMETVAGSLLAMLGAGVAERHVCLLPLAVLLENVAGVYTALLAGATCHIRPVAQDPVALAIAIAEAHATSCILVPELLRMLVAAKQPLPSLRFAAVGGARVDTALLEAAHALAIPVYEGYGLSEACSVVSLNTPAGARPGSVGRLLPHQQLRIAPDGEIWLGAPLFGGYLGQPEPTGGWYATGDIGHLDAQGFLHIAGRKRNVYITSFGRNVSPEWPESLLASHPAVAQAAVFGEARPFSVAVIAARQPQAVPAALAAVNARLPDYARIGAYVLAAEPFTPANGLLTGTGRPRRDAIAAQYGAAISQCYLTTQETTA